MNMNNKMTEHTIRLGKSVVTAHLSQSRSHTQCEMFVRALGRRPEVIFANAMVANSGNIRVLVVILSLLSESERHQSRPLVASVNVGTMAITAVREEFERMGALHADLASVVAPPKSIVIDVPD